MAVNMPLSIQISTRLTPPGPAAWPSILISWTAGKLRPSSGTSIHAEASLDAGKLHAPSTRASAKSRLQMIGLHGNERMRNLRGVRGFRRPPTFAAVDWVGLAPDTVSQGTRTTAHCTRRLSHPWNAAGWNSPPRISVRRVSFSDPQRGGATLLAGFPLVYYLTSTPFFQHDPCCWPHSYSTWTSPLPPLFRIVTPSPRVSPLPAPLSQGASRQGWQSSIPRHPRDTPHPLARGGIKPPSRILRLAGAGPALAVTDPPQAPSSFLGVVGWLSGE